MQEPYIDILFKKDRICNLIGEIKINKISNPLLNIKKLENLKSIIVHTMYID